jgi:hypothetical protein
VQYGEQTDAAGAWTGLDADKMPILVQVASAFSQMLNLHNLSEEISNAQIEKASRIGEVGRRVEPVHPELL